MPDDERRPLFTEGQIRGAFLATGVGMVAVLVLLLILASARPQGRFAVADSSQFDATVRSATAELEGFELVGDDRARLDIDHAIDVVAERGVGLELTALDADGPTAAETDAAEDGEDAQAANGEGEEAAADGEEGDGPDGESLYAANCAACHQANGQGVPGAFPPLAGNLPELVGADGGRDYLVQAVLHGVQGPMEVDGQSYDGVMPAWPQLSDAEIAAVLNHELTAWEDGALPDGFEPIAADEVASARELDTSPSEVLELRPDPQ